MMQNLRRLCGRSRSRKRTFILIEERDRPFEDLGLRFRNSILIKQVNELNPGQFPLLALALRFEGFRLVLFGAPQHADYPCLPDRGDFGEPVL